MRTNRLSGERLFFVTVCAAFVEVGFRNYLKDLWQRCVLLLYIKSQSLNEISYKNVRILSKHSLTNSFGAFPAMSMRLARQSRFLI